MGNPKFAIVIHYSLNNQLKFYHNRLNRFRRLCILKLLNFANPLVLDFVLKKLDTISLSPLPVLRQIGPIVKPRKSKLLGYFFSVIPRRFMTFGFVGCNVSMQSFIRCCIVFNTYNDCFSVLQRTTMSSA